MRASRNGEMPALLYQLLDTFREKSSSAAHLL